MNEHKKPNFLLIGTPKAGTTSIASYLGEHPEIFMPEEKEPFYFIEDIVKKIAKDDPMLDAIMNKATLNWNDYLKLFENASDSEQMRGEATVHYLYHYDTVIPKIKERLGDIPIVLVLRDPVKRAYSNYMYQNRGQLNSFETALEMEEEKIKKGWNSFWFYKHTGNYCKPVSAYLNNFSNVYIATFEEFQENNVIFMQNIYTFLKVNKNYIPNTNIQYNPTLIPKNVFLKLIYYFQHKYKISTRLVPKFIKQYIRKKSFKVSKVKLNVETSKNLYKYFERDIKCLEGIVGRKFKKWKYNEK